MNILSLQDDHKLALDDLGKRYGVDLTKVTTHKHKRSHLHMHTRTQTHTQQRVAEYPLQRCNLCSRLRPAATLVKLDPPQRPHLTLNLIHL